VGWINVVIALMRVDLPAPFLPRRPKTSPRRTVKLTPSKAKRRRSYECRRFSAKTTGSDPLADTELRGLPITGGHSAWAANKGCSHQMSNTGVRRGPSRRGRSCGEQSVERRSEG